MQIRGKGVKNLGHALWQALTGRAYSSMEKATPQQATQVMIDRWGSTKAVAQKLGVSVRTVQRWKSGQQAPSKRNIEKFNAAHREARLTPGRREQMAGAGTASGPDKSQAGTGGLAIFGTIRVSEDERERWINPGTRMTPAESDDIINAMIQQGPDAAAAALNNVIGRYVPGMQVIEIQEIDY